MLFPNKRHELFTCGQEKPLCLPGDFCPLVFKEKFTHDEFKEILSCLCGLRGNSLVDDQGNTVLLRNIGKHPKDMITCWADSPLLVFLRRFVRPVVWIDLQLILEGRKTEFSRVFQYMMNMLYKRYDPMVCDIHVWKIYFPSFPDHMKKLGMTFDGTMGFWTANVRRLSDREVKVVCSSTSRTLRYVQRISSVIIQEFGIH